MSTETVNQMVERLVQAGSLTLERFAELLGAPLKPEELNPFWRTYSFELAHGPFARGELRLKTSGDGALLILEPRTPPGLSEADVDRAAWGPILSVAPNPRIAPEGIATETFEKNGVNLAVQWTSQSRRLRALVLKWEPPTADDSSAQTRAADVANLN